MGSGVHGQVDLPDTYLGPLRCNMYSMYQPKRKRPKRKSSVYHKGFGLLVALCPLISLIFAVDVVALLSAH